MSCNLASIDHARQRLVVEFLNEINGPKGFREGGVTSSVLARVGAKSMASRRPTSAWWS